MATGEQEIRQLRREKTERIRGMGINPFPYRFDPNCSCVDAVSSYNDDQKGQRYRMAGRLVALRDHGRSVFAEIQDQTGRMQIYMEKPSMQQSQLGVLDSTDLGDIVGVEGEVFRTRRGQVTLKVANYQLLAKALLSLPDKRHGLQDPELVYRRRTEYFIANPEAREGFVKRSKAISAMRSFLDSNRFLEVEIPSIQPVYGGASAKPFRTRVNALGQDNFLSISPELYLKRLIAGGFERVYTICKNFRNEGIDRTHNPEFTMMECYQSYADYSDMMKLTENMYADIFQKVLGTTKISYGNQETGKGNVTLDFTPPWRRAKMLDIVAETTGIEVGSMNDVQLRMELSRTNDEGFFAKAVPREDLGRWSWGELVQSMFEHYCQDNIIQPTFVIDHPRETTPLCKIHREDPRLIERFEPFVYGWEIGNAYSELNDPSLQRSLLEEQVRTRKDDSIPGEVDEDFCRAVDIGMPPTGGLGLGIDRMAMFVTGSATIKDIILFPMLKREDNQNGR